MGTHFGRDSVFFRQYGAVIECVEPYYADLAVAFHWPPSEIDALSYDDLLMFRELAKQRVQSESQ
ncbi:GpE family phage tail protein [uncultured Vibrio sp.]|uniref:GpE family phage tail protein n=1 Tax=uncultured Vibrio sp. TaxID=114054 RepID=UPI00260DB8CF|nr:GpE family phage tail protein [uncultured Vibrio sp.]